MANKYKGFKFLKPTKVNELVTNLNVAWLDTLKSANSNTLVLTNGEALFGVNLLKITKVNTEVSYSIISKEIKSKRDSKTFLVWELKH